MDKGNYFIANGYKTHMIGLTKGIRREGLLWIIPRLFHNKCSTDEDREGI